MLFGLAASSVVIFPFHPTRRLGQVTKLRCQASSSIKRCIWAINGRIDYDPNLLGNFKHGECDYNLKLLSDKAVEVTCHVFPSNNPLAAEHIFETANTSVTTVVLPKIQLESQFKIDDNDTITVIDGKAGLLTCTVSGARPKPAVLWKIGNPILHKQYKSLLAIHTFLINWQSMFEHSP